MQLAPDEDGAAHVIEDCRNDPAFERPESFLNALRTALTRGERHETS